MNKTNIGRRIATYREKLKMSTQELANRVNRSQATISRIENGKQGVTPELLTGIARVLCVHPFALLSDSPLRHSMLLPVSGENEGEYVTNLLANAIHAGRLRSGLRGAEAAETLDVPIGELRMIEMGLTLPEMQLLDKISKLYGLVPEEMRILADIDREAPDISRRLANLQHILSKISFLCQSVKPGEEAKALSDIKAIVQLVDSEYPMPRNEIARELGLLDDRGTEHFVKALKNKDFLQQVKELIKLHEADLAAGFREEIAPRTETESITKEIAPQETDPLP